MVTKRCCRNFFPVVFLLFLTGRRDDNQERKHQLSIFNDEKKIQNILTDCSTFEVKIPSSLSNFGSTCNIPYSFISYFFLSPTEPVGGGWGADGVRKKFKIN